MSLLACVRSALRVQALRRTTCAQLNSSHRPFASLGGPPMRPAHMTGACVASSRFPRPLAPLTRTAVLVASDAGMAPRGLRALHVWNIDKKAFQTTQVGKERKGYQVALLEGRIHSAEQRAAALAHNDAMCFLHGLDGYPVDAVRACEHLQKAVDGGFAPAMILLAQHYLMGVGVPFDALEGVRLLRVAAEGGCLEAQVELARVLIVSSRTRDDPFLARRCEYVTGSQRNHLHGAMRAAKDIGGDAREGVRLLEEAAAAGNDTALAHLGAIHLRLVKEQELPPPEVLQPDGDLGISLMRRAAEAGNIGAVHILASILISDPTTEAKGEELLRQSAAMGNLQSHAQLADRLLRSQDPATAAEGRAMARKAAEGGDLEALFVYACALLKGMGGSADIAEGATWLLRAGEGGLVIAQTMLGVAHDGGDKDLGFVANEEKSLYWHTLAAWGGSMHSQIALAAHYLGASGGTVNHAEALFWMERAAQCKDPKIMYQTGAMYIKGMGTPKHPEKGWAYVRLAAEQGSELALTNMGYALLTGVAAPQVEQDVSRGEEILEHATAKGSLRAKAVLAQYYIHGNDDTEHKEQGERMLMEALEVDPAILERLGLLV